MSLAEAEKEGSILMGHGLLLPSALLLEKKLPIDEGRLLDLCSLMNAIVLHDKLVTLPATIPDHIKRSGLYTYLIDRDLIHPLEFSYDEIEFDEIREMMGHFRGTTIPSIEDAKEVLGDLHNYKYKYIYKWSEERLDKEKQHILDKRRNLINGILTSEPKDLLDIGKDDRNFLLGSKEEGMRIHSLRTIVYSKISEITGIPFMPDFLRIPLIAGYNLKLINDIRMSPQYAGDSLNRKSMEEIMPEMQAIRIPMPGITSRFLRTYNGSNLPEAIDTLREQFLKERKFIVDKEKKMRSGAKNVKDLIKTNNEIRSSIESLRSENREDLGETIIDFTGTIAQAALTALASKPPVEETITGIKLGKKLFKGLVRHHNLGHVNYYSLNMEEAITIGHRDDLLNNAFGSSLGVDGLRRFLQLTAYFDKLITKSNTIKEKNMIIRDDKQAITELHTPLEILKLRLAKGEINKDEFLEMRHMLES